MSSTFTDRENQGWRSNNNLFRKVTIKGIDTQVLVDGEVLMYDETDNTFIVYDAAAGKLAVAILSLGVGETITLDVADTLTPQAMICIGGQVLADYIKLPGIVEIDDRPAGAVKSVRLQLRDVGINADDSDTTNENHLA